ncbi:hypothetical protein [uncultured Rikenella sp.]|uniref:hypothetical protein n=1 Tax=uncultured Rikenella sp. TaxID=368003 RepID=UPI0025F0FDA8|nr:hypothetical protein [uncultured Rikenella sp.]
MPLGINGKKSPAPGFRNSASGDPMNVGANGFSWSSATGSTGGQNLHFNTPYLYTSNSDHHAHGFQLRCLSE